MHRLNQSIIKSVGVVILGGLSSATIHASSLPESTALPVRFTRSIDAGSVHPGDSVTAKTLQIVVLPTGETLPKGTAVLGHIVDAQPFYFDSTPYAHQVPSRVSIHFDRLVNGGNEIPVNLSVRALANTLESQEAAYPHHTDETDSLGTMILIGGNEFSPLENSIEAPSGDVIGYNRKHGVFARLLASSYSNSNGSSRCNETDTEQSIAIFSPSACGVYGFANLYMPSSGSDGSGTFSIASTHRSVKLYAGSTALLQVVAAQ